MATNRIVSPPPGEAPLAVREAWVGLELPLPPGRGSHQRPWRGFGVLSGPRTLWQELTRIVLGRVNKNPGYVVNALAAINLLAVKDPSAAAWWREHCPHLLTGRRYFVFAAEACEVLSATDGT